MSDTHSNPELPKHQIYELVVADVLKKFDANATVKHDVKLPSANGKRKRQIDVYIEGKIAGMPLNIIVDCKYYDKKLDVKDVEQFIGMVEDIKPNLGILISPVGFSSGAIDRVKEYGTRISLCSIFNGNHIDYSTPLGIWMYRIERTGLKLKITITNGNQAMKYPLPAPELWMVEDMFGKRMKLLDVAAETIIEDKSLMHDKTGFTFIDTDKYLFVDGVHTIKLAEMKVWFDSVITVGKRYIRYTSGTAIVKEKEVTTLTPLSTDIISVEGDFEPLSLKQTLAFLKSKGKTIN
ncbi:restriction endonuclease (plasmid) [Mucilaginibacter robiniae]|uniref:Restriction endonuclease n=1 Tax=Mucilaginibacter robiniae TaxID=2728022 RepID=A0A7L5E6G5_9SPHI|nr:restriction endonuclease [Mucilaginibacter robiniae]QJD98571.1 restriction endonuclease [Mucilaginibacter robiniae]